MIFVGVLLILIKEGRTNIVDTETITREEMQRLDRRAIERYRIPELLLM